MKKINLLTFLTIITFNFDTIAQTQELLEYVCPYILNGNYAVIPDTNKERHYQININSAKLGVLMTWPQPLGNPPVFPGDLSEIQEDISSAQESFRQLVMLNADRWSEVGSGTLVYIGDADVDDLPQFYFDNPTACQQRRILVTVETNVLNNPANLGGQLQSLQSGFSKCVYTGSDGKPYSYSTKIVIFTHTINNNGAIQKIHWYLGDNNNLSRVLLHEFGHSYNVEHALSTYPSVMGIGTPYGKLAEWDVKCIRHRGGPRSYKTFARNIHAYNNLESEYEILPANKTESIASGCYKDGSWWTHTMIYENSFANSINWYKNIFDNNNSSQIFNLSNVNFVQDYVNDNVQSSSFQIWRENESISPVLKRHVYSTPSALTSGGANLFGDKWIINTKIDYINYWASNTHPSFNLKYRLGTNSTTDVVSEYPPSITWDPIRQKTLFIWNDYVQGATLISSGYYSNSFSGTLNKPKKIVGDSGSKISKMIPPSVACNYSDVCIIVYTVEAGISGQVSDTSWKDQNVIKIGRLNLNDINNTNSPNGENTYLYNISSLPLILGQIKRRTSKQPAIYFDGSKFWIIFRGSYWPYQRLNAFFSTDGISWTYSSTFDSLPWGTLSLGGSSYSSSAPSISSYVPGCSSLIYSRP